MFCTSVIIPTKNRSKELQRAIHSVLSQTYQQFEIIVVDDHSEEDIRSCVESFNDNRITYYKSTKSPSNANVCRNIGLQNAKGGYIAMLDSDDEWLPIHLEQKINFIEQNNCDGVFGSYFIDDGIEKLEVISRPLKSNELMGDYLLTDGRAATPTHVYKAAASKSVIWDEGLLRHQDFDYSINFSKKFKFLPSDKITCIVHWDKKTKRTEHLESQRRFINKHRENISPVVFNKYNQLTYQKIRHREDVPKDIKNFFKSNASRYIHDITFNQFVGVHSEDTSRMERILLRFHYLIRVLVA